MPGTGSSATPNTLPSGRCSPHGNYERSNKSKTEE
jgi:hypothetical protein